MNCPLCGTPLKQHLIQPNVSLISCPSTECVFPFNLSMEEIQHQNLLITDINNNDIMNMMQSKMIDVANVDQKIALFISKLDHDLD